VMKGVNLRASYSQAVKTSHNLLNKGHSEALQLQVLTSQLAKCF